jgi:hypothetical protein
MRVNGQSKNRGYAEGVVKYRRSSSFIALQISLAMVLAGCGGGYVGQAKRAYSQGRYLEVAEGLGEHEDEVEDLSPRRKAEYGLYRGLSLMMLRDYRGAEQWLSFARAVEKQSPDALRPEQREELDRHYVNVMRVLNATQATEPASVTLPASGAPPVAHPMPPPPP